MNIISAVVEASRRGLISLIATLISYRLGGVYTVRCRNADGSVAWERKAKNLITSEGLNHALNVLLGSASKTTTWYVGLIDSSGYVAVAAGDTNGSHGGWTENTNYSGGARKSFTAGVGTSTAQSISNSGAPASFAITATVTIKGCFLSSLSTAGSGGVMWSAGTFTSAQSLVNGQTLEVVYTCTSANGS